MYNQVNKMLYIGAVVLLFSASMFVACQSKQDKTTEEANEATQEDAIQTKASAWLSFKENTEAIIENNEARIKVLKEKIQKPGMPNIDKLRQKRIDELEARNTALRAKLGVYKEDDIKTTLEQFKMDVQKELDEMEQTLKELDEK